MNVLRLKNLVKSNSFYQLRPNIVDKRNYIIISSVDASRPRNGGGGFQSAPHNSAVESAAR